MSKKLYDIFENVVASSPEKAAFYFANRSITYQVLQNSILECERELIRIGIEEGTKVLLQMEEPEVFACMIFSIWKLHGIYIPIEKKVTVEELNRAKEESNCDFYITVSGTSDNFKNMDGDFAFVQYEKIVHEKSVPCEEGTALMFYTSGTTGLPKCVTFSHDAMTNNIITVAEKMNLSTEDIFYTPLVLTLPATITTVLLPALCSGTSLFISNTQLPRVILKNISTNSITVFFAVPYMFELMIQTMNREEYNFFANVKVCVSSSSFMKPYIFEQFYEKTGLFIHSIYCSSEAGAITYNDAKDLETIKNSVGQSLPGVQTRIYMREDVAKENEIGEIVISGANMSSGYFSRPELQKKVFLKSGVKTGDLACKDKKGFLTLHGRISDVINVAGYLVNPKEVEDLILTMDGISDVVVYGVSKDIVGEYIAAKIILEDRQQIKEQDIIKYCSQHMSNYKVPREVEFVESIQTGRYGKKVRKM